MVHVWGFDPGETTGWAHISINDNEVSLFRVGELGHLELGDMLHNDSVFGHALDHDLTFVCEAFLPSPKKTFAPWSLETIGLIRYWAYVYHIPFILQQPSAVKSLVKDNILKKLSLWTPGKRHANDAVLHSVYYLVKERGLLQHAFSPSGD